ncbi:hypothetical protein [Bradyrhizobium sp.]|uniref:hypothetical protein n=1 Tax=Bradyrhizobium sp. TaxID=376 RepID=UPI00260B5138|nr:hypothetical protein [Bradyrhizobium sp.]
MTYLRLLSALAWLTVTTGGAFAADQVFPTGARIGMTPLVGLVPAKTFTGFETEDQSVKVLIAELPAAAYGEVMNTFKNNPAIASVKPESLETAAGTAYYTVDNAKNTSGVIRHYSMILSGGTFSGYVDVQVPENATKIYSDDAVRQMLASAVIRKEVPVNEQLSLMPFKVGNLGDFKNVRALGATGALLLADGDETKGFEAAPFMVIGLMASAPSEPEDRARFADQAARAIPGLHTGHITMSEPVRIESMAGYETRIDGTSGRDNTPVTVVQWMRFGGQGAMRVIGSAPRDQWEKAFPRFRAVRDSIAPRS